MKKQVILIFAVFLFDGIISCKKNNSESDQSNTFLKIYNVPIQRNDKSNNTTIASSGDIVSDKDGNMYIWYYDSSIADLGRLAILKTDGKGNKIWNSSYMPLWASRTDIDLNYNFYFKEDFACIGQSLFICGHDSLGNWQLLKINCSDGKIATQFPLNGLQPSYRPFNLFQVRAMWPTSEGNLLISTWSATPSGFQTPSLCMMDPSGTMSWITYFPSRVHDSAHFRESPCCLKEVSSGNYIFGTIGQYDFSDSSGNSLSSFTIYLHHMSGSGTILSTDSLYQGTYNNSGSPAFIGSNGAAQIFSAFPSAIGGYVIASVEMYDFDQDIRIKILKTTASLTVTDSSYISLGSSVYTSIMQDRSGNVVMSAFNQVTPWPNAICDVYKIAPNGSVTGPVAIGLPSQSAFISGMCRTNDDRFFMAGLIQSGNIDINNLFMLKTDNNAHY